jgi:hypothetical protein
MLKSMTLIKSLTLFIALFLIGAQGILAQQDVISSGGKATGSGGSASFSVGQVNYSYIKTTDGSASQGVQQTWQISVVYQDTTGKGFDISATTYPNPASTYLKLRIDEGKIEDMSYKLYDEEGRYVTGDNIVDRETTINIRDLKHTLYFLKVYKSIFVMKTFKIVKTS